MNASGGPLLSAADLVALGRQARPKDCPRCAALVCPGWESLPGGFDASLLQRVGSLCDPAAEDPTLDEYHPAGSNRWSANAPIAPAFFPYNRCDVWTCVQCARPFLRYTEHGGYYSDERIRELNPDLVVAPP